MYGERAGPKVYEGRKNAKSTFLPLLIPITGTVHANIYLRPFMHQQQSHIIYQGLNDLNSIFNLQITDVTYRFSETKVLIKASCNPSYCKPILVNLNTIHVL